MWQICILTVGPPSFLNRSHTNTIPYCTFQNSPNFYISPNYHAFLIIFNISGTSPDHCHIASKPFFSFLGSLQLISFSITQIHHTPLQMQSITRIWSTANSVFSPLKAILPVTFSFLSQCKIRLHSRYFKTVHSYMAFSHLPQLISQPNVKVFNIIGQFGFSVSLFPNEYKYVKQCKIFTLPFERKCLGEGEFGRPDNYPPMA